MVLGFLGVGHLASYTIEGLRHAGDRRRIVLSPRNSAVAAELVERHGCELAEHNQAVIDSCEAVVLSVRPDSVADLLSDVQFKSGQLVISVMAGVSLRDLQKHSNLCDVVLVRSLPIQCAAVGVGPLPLYPGNAVAGEILAPLGTVVTLASEGQFETAATLGCMHGWVYPWLAAMSVWAEQQGLDAEAAAELARSSVAGAVAFSQSMSADHIAAIGEGIASEGTYTLAGLKVLQSGGGIEAWMAAMNTVNDKALGR